MFEKHQKQLATLSLLSLLATSGCGPNNKKDDSSQGPTTTTITDQSPSPEKPKPPQEKKNKPPTGQKLRKEADQRNSETNRILEKELKNIPKPPTDTQRPQTKPPTRRTLYVSPRQRKNQQTWDKLRKLSDQSGSSIDRSLHEMSKRAAEQSRASQTNLEQLRKKMQTNLRERSRKTQKALDEFVKGMRRRSRTANPPSNSGRSQRNSDSQNLPGSRNPATVPSGDLAKIALIALKVDPKKAEAVSKTLSYLKKIEAGVHAASKAVNKNKPKQTEKEATNILQYEDILISISEAVDNIQIPNVQEPSSGGRTFADLLKMSDADLQKLAATNTRKLNATKRQLKVLRMLENALTKDHQTATAVHKGVGILIRETQEALKAPLPEPFRSILMNSWLKLQGRISPITGNIRSTLGRKLKKTRQRIERAEQFLGQ